MFAEHRPLDARVQFLVVEAAHGKSPRLHGSNGPELRAMFSKAEKLNRIISITQSLAPGDRAEVLVQEK